MLCLIPILGGLLIVMGQHTRSEALLHHLRLEDQNSREPSAMESRLPHDITHLGTVWLPLPARSKAGWFFENIKESSRKIAQPLTSCLHAAQNRRYDAFGIAVTTRKSLTWR